VGRPLTQIPRRNPFESLGYRLPNNTLKRAADAPGEWVVNLDFDGLFGRPRDRRIGKTARSAACPHTR